MDYRKMIRDKRIAMGLSQNELAKKVGIAQAFMHEIESGKKNPSVDVLIRICEVLEIPLFPEE